MKSKNRILVKNTIAQYIKIIVSVLVNIISVRIVLDQLGVEDYGIYTVIAGFVALFSVLNNSMIVSVQRFLSCEISTNNIENVKKLYTNSLFLHFLLAIFVLIVCETLGLYFVSNYLNFPIEKTFTVHIVYQCVVFTFILNIISIPVQAALFSFEKIYLISVISIAQTFLKLLAALGLCLFRSSHLIVYCFFLFLISLIVLFLYVYIVRRSLNLKFCLSYDSATIRKLTNFAGWNLFGGIANVGRVQGLNILLNMFLGLSINTAYGIANQVNSQLLFFSSSIFQASNSQIIQSYRLHDYNRLNFLICSSTKFAFTLYFIVSLPIFICTDDILYIWLGNIPNYCGVFLKLMLLNSYIELFSNPLMFVMQASGNIKKYFIIISSVMIMILPLSFICLYLGLQPYSVLFITILINIVLLILRVKFAEKTAKYNCSTYIKSVLIPASLIIFVSIFLLEYIDMYLYNNAIIKVVIIALLGFVVVSSLTFCIMLKKDERKVIFNFFKRHIC